MLRFQVRLKGLNEKQTYPGKIIGFSNRINSILVPYDFLTWANERFGYLKKEAPSRIILVANDPTNPEIVNYIDQNGYDTIREKLKSSRLNIILKFVLNFLILIASIIIGLAFLIFMLSLQLMISRSAEKIRRLNKLGFHPFEISRPYIIVLLLLLLIVTAGSLGITAILSGKLSEVASGWNLEVDPNLTNKIFMIAPALILLLFLLNAISIIINTRKLCSKQ
jgi:hypothetical protein